MLNNISLINDDNHGVLLIKALLYNRSVIGMKLILGKN